MSQVKKDSTKKLKFIKFMSELISILPSRSQKIVKDRFGVTKGEVRTLESIGQEYKITRERVRQIIKEGIKKVKERKGEESMQKVEKEIKFTLNNSNGIILLDKLLTDLAGSNKKEKGAINFFLQTISEIEKVGENKGIKDALIEDGFNLKEWKSINNKVRKLLETENVTLSEDELYTKFCSIEKIGKKKLFDYLAVSCEVEKNNFGKWGLSQWSEINPKGTREKSYLVIKEIGTPLHFKDVARIIDEYKLNKRKTHPQTVHNELIKDKRFVLIGRGTYALTEWGYKRGTVKDVLTDILSESEQPLGREEILNKVLSSRKVKKSTVMINLNNFFVRIDGDKYTVKNKKQKEENKA